MKKSLNNWNRLPTDKTLQRNHSVAPIYMLKSYKKGQINHTGPTTRHRDFLCSWYFLSAAKEIPRAYATQKFIKVYIRFLHRTAQRTISIPLTTSQIFSLRSTLVLSCHIRPVPQIVCAIQTLRLLFHPHAFRPFRYLPHFSPILVLRRLLQKADRLRITKILSLALLSSTRT